MFVVIVVVKTPTLIVTKSAALGALNGSKLANDSIMAEHIANVAVICLLSHGLTARRMIVTSASAVATSHTLVDASVNEVMIIELFPNLSKLVSVAVFFTSL